MYLKNKLLMTADALIKPQGKILAEFSATVLKKHPPEINKYTPQVALALTFYQALVSQIKIIDQENTTTINGHNESLQIKMSESYNSENRKINNELHSGLWQPEIYLKQKKSEPKRQLEGNCTEIANLMMQLLAPFGLEMALYLMNNESQHVYLLAKLDNIIYQINPKINSFEFKLEKDEIALTYFKQPAEEKQQESNLILEYYDGIIKYRQGYLDEAQELFRKLVQENERWFIYEKLALIAAQQKKYLTALRSFQLAEECALPAEQEIMVQEKKRALMTLLGL